MEKGKCWPKNIALDDVLGDVEEATRHLIEYWCAKIVMDIEKDILYKNKRDRNSDVKGCLALSLSLTETANDHPIPSCAKTEKEKLQRFFHPIFVLKEKREMVITSGFFKNKKRISEEYALTLSPLAKWALRELKKSAQEQGIFIAKISFSVGGFEARKQVSLDAFLEFPRKMIFDVGEGCLFSREWGILCDRPIEEQSIFPRMHIEYAMPPKQDFT